MDIKFDALDDLPDWGGDNIDGINSQNQEIDLDKLLNMNNAEAQPKESGLDFLEQIETKKEEKPAEVPEEKSTQELMGSLWSFVAQAAVDTASSAVG